MKLSRRALLRSIPIIGAAIAAVSWWFLGPTERKQKIESQIPVEEKSLATTKFEHEKTSTTIARRKRQLLERLSISQ